MMKLFLSRIIPLVVLAVLLLGTACEYDVTEPGWYDEHENPVEPQIISMEPTVATAGYNTLKIIGEHFVPEADKSWVYFDNVPADILDVSATFITVRRPDVAGDSITVKVSTSEALIVAEFGPYTVQSVYEKFGDFNTGGQLNAVAVDKLENVYVCQDDPTTIYRISPKGEKTVLGESSRSVTDAKIDPDGNLLLLTTNNIIFQINTESGEETEWVDAGRRVNVAYGDFDPDGYFYAGGRRTGVAIVAPDLSITKDNNYGSDEILCMRYYDGYLYFIVDGGDPELAIWRHPVSNGTIGDAELVMDWSESGEYAESLPNSITFGADGTMYVATSYDSPIMRIEPDYINGIRDILYKDILPTTAEHFYWGTGNYLYMISGGSDWTLYRVDMGEEGAPYLGIE